MTPRYLLLSLVGLLLAVPPAVAEPPRQSDPPNKVGSAPDKKPIPVAGTVTEVLASGGYTYVNLATTAGPVWAAFPTMPVTVGQNLTLVPGYEMRNFSSTSLNRKFERIIFSSGPSDKQAWDPNLLREAHKPGAATAPAPPGSPPAAALPSKVPPAAAAKIPPHARTKEAAGVRVKKAAGANAYTVSDLYGRRAKLNGRKVVVRGKVVKVNPRILKQCWVHIQDGSGTPGRGDMNLVTTTPSATLTIPAVGSVVTVTGTLRKDRDFGGGYRYAVILENSTYRIEGAPQPRP